MILTGLKKSYTFSNKLSNDLKTHLLGRCIHILIGILEKHKHRQIICKVLELISIFDLFLHVYVYSI